MSHSYSFPCCCLVVVVRVILLVLLLSARIFAKTKEGFASSENLIQRHTIQKTFIQNTQTEEDQMSAAANSAAYWRIAGMSYLKYANACAEIVRGALKEPHLSKVLLLSLLSLSVRESIDPFSSSRSKLSLLTIFSLFHKRLERGTRCTLKRRNTWKDPPRLPWSRRSYPRKYPSNTIPTMCVGGN